MERNDLEFEPTQSQQLSPTRFEQKDGPTITPSLFFTDEEDKSVDWDAVFEQW